MAVTMKMLVEFFFSHRHVEPLRSPSYRDISTSPNIGICGICALLFAEMKGRTLFLQ